MEFGDRIKHELPSATDESIAQFGNSVITCIIRAEELRGGADPDDPVYDQH
jgi:hypothetical protein